MLEDVRTAYSSDAGWGFHHSLLLCEYIRVSLILIYSLQTMMTSLMTVQGEAEVGSC